MKQKIIRVLRKVTSKVIAFLLTWIIRLCQRTPIDLARVLSSMPKGVKEYWLHLNCRNYEEKAYEYDYNKDCLGHVTYVDQNELNEYTDNPGDYELGYSLQNHIEVMTDDRAEEINEGRKLTEAELEKVELIVAEIKNEADDMMSYVGFVERCGKQDVYVVFEGQSQGQGGILLTFFDIYRTRYDAEQELKKNKHFWEP